ncbi:hypothetical protein K431DRAFT_128803 [Polychaeton citri CBS 116435]|uniref:Uncharacterized protein n=1 Tax=Polychaeton citri CBS 116435 TaxID=1314669 RepID=A0A9P4Q2L7_9PEZI|nr:hypothetical protein K431DRAFT_128803 [Polychaeton citri CBS 116435]
MATRRPIHLHCVLRHRVDARRSSATTAAKRPADSKTDRRRKMKTKRVRRRLHATAAYLSTSLRVQEGAARVSLDRRATVAILFCAKTSVWVPKAGEGTFASAPPAHHLQRRPYFAARCHPIDHLTTSLLNPCPRGVDAVDSSTPTVSQPPSIASATCVISFTASTLASRYNCHSLSQPKRASLGIRPWLPCSTAGCRYITMACIAC